MGSHLLLSYVSPEPERQGHASYTHVHEIVNGLRAQGWKVDLYCPQYDEKSLPAALTRLLGIARVMLRVIAADCPQVYYMRWHFAAFPVALYARLRGIPTVIEVNGPVDDLFIAWPKTRYVKWLFQYLMNAQLRWSSGVVAVTVGLNCMARDIVGFATPIRTIPNAANTQQFTPEALRTDNAYTKALPETFMVFFGTMARWQGIRTVLAAVADAAWPKGVHAVFVGDGVEREAVEACAVQFDHVHYLGRIPYTDLPAITARAIGSFVCTEDTRGRSATGLAPLKLFESLASGIPVVATEMPFQADIVRSGKCGYIVPPGNAAELARVVSELAGDPERAWELGRNARAVAVHEHSWAARAKDTHDLLLRALGRDT